MGEPIYSSDEEFEDFDKAATWLVKTTFIPVLTAMGGSFFLATAMFEIAVVCQNIIVSKAQCINHLGAIAVELFVWITNNKELLHKIGIGLEFIAGSEFGIIIYRMYLIRRKKRKRST